MVRYVWCPAFGHHKGAGVCRKAPYEECVGCGVAIDDRSWYGSRIFAVVESMQPPPPGTRDCIELEADGLIVVPLKENENQSTGTVSEESTLARAYKRLTRKKRGKKRR